MSLADNLKKCQTTVVGTYANTTKRNGTNNTRETNQDTTTHNGKIEKAIATKITKHDKAKRNTPQQSKADSKQLLAEVHALLGLQSLAIEAHVGQELDAPEKAVWLVEAVGRASVRLNFDHSHFHVLGMELQRCVELCAPYAVHTHLKDGRMVDGRVQFLLPGDGDLDLEAYFRAVSGAGITVPITVEVSAQIWNRDNYDAWATAGRAYEAMRGGMERAGVA